MNKKECQICHKFYEEDWMYLVTDTKKIVCEDCSCKFIYCERGEHLFEELEIYGYKEDFACEDHYPF